MSRKNLDHENIVKITSIFHIISLLEDSFLCPVSCENYAATKVRETNRYTR